MIPIYVIGNAETEPDRVRYLQTEFDKWNLSVQWIQPSWKTTLTGAQKDQFVPYMPLHRRPLNSAEMSLFLNFVAVFLKAFKDLKADTDVCLILESDVIFERPLPPYLEGLQEWIQTVKPDCVSLGSGCDLIHDDVNTEDMNFQIFPKRLIRCTDTFLFSKRGIRHFLSYLQSYGKWDEPIDNFFETFVKTHPDFTLFWVWPSLTLQGSQYGYSKSTIQDSS